MKAHTSKVMYWLKLGYTLISLTFSYNFNYTLNTSVDSKWYVRFFLLLSNKLSYSLY